MVTKVILLLPITAALATCPTPNFPAPSVVNTWRFQGAREKCFCAYSQLSNPPTLPELTELTTNCPDWHKYVSSDNITANKVHRHMSATILGSKASNISTSRYGSIPDWSIDLGSGYGNECNQTLAPGCVSIGSHVLSIPNENYYQDCCTVDDGKTPSLAAALQTDPATTCATLKNMVSGAVQHVQNLEQYVSCHVENQDPTQAHRCLAQCFHYRPDVNWVHLHTTAGVLLNRDGPIDSGLGPVYNRTEIDDPAVAYGKYNVCVCEPSSWGEEEEGSTSKGSTRGSTNGSINRGNRGHCPTALPHETSYVEQAAVSLCQNIAGASGINISVCDSCKSNNKTKTNKTNKNSKTNKNRSR